MVDFRGRWINDDDEYDDEEEEEEEQDRQMEDFDPVNICPIVFCILFVYYLGLQDAVDDDDEDDEEDEEDDVPTHGQHLHARQHSERSPHLEMPARASPVSPDASQAADDKSLIDLSVYTSLPSFGRLSGANNKVKAVRQLSVPQRTEWVGSA
jgi:casein kinase II subunit beta